MIPLFSPFIKGVGEVPLVPWRPQILYQPFSPLRLMILPMCSFFRRLNELCPAV